MEKRKVVIALGHRALGNTLPEQKAATKSTAKIIARLVKEGAEIVIVHSNAPQVGMIHTAMNEFGKYHPDYTFAPMSVCSAMSQGYIGYDLQNAIRSELMKEGVYKPVCTVLTQVTVDPYDDAFAEPVKVAPEPDGQEGRHRPQCVGFKGAAPEHHSAFRGGTDLHAELPWAAVHLQFMLPRIWLCTGEGCQQCMVVFFFY